MIRCPNLITDNAIIGYGIRTQNIFEKQNAPGGGDEYVCRQARVRESIRG
jgi:hypothetical protein